MIPARESSVSLFNLARQNSAIVTALRPALASLAKPRVIEKGTSTACSDDHLFIVTKGTLCLENRGKAVAWFVETEMIGRWFGAGSDARMRAVDEDVCIDEIPLVAFIELVVKDSSHALLWQQYLEESSAVMADLFTEHGAIGDAPPPILTQFSRGQPIMIEGSTGEHVFTLIQGKADVFVSGQKVGEIPMNQIFGAAAVLTDEPRSASVIATEDCLALRFDRITFREMLKTHPELVIKLVEDMASILKEMNEKIVAIREAQH